MESSRKRDKAEMRALYRSKFTRKHRPKASEHNKLRSKNQPEPSAKDRFPFGSVIPQDMTFPPGAQTVYLGKDGYKLAVQMKSYRDNGEDAAFRAEMSKREAYWYG